MSTPILTSWATPRGVSPSPHTFSRGKAPFSSRSTSTFGAGQVEGGGGTGRSGTHHDDLRLLVTYAVILRCKAVALGGAVVARVITFGGHPITMPSPVRAGP